MKLERISPEQIRDAIYKNAGREAPLTRAQEVSSDNAIAQRQLEADQEKIKELFEVIERVRQEMPE